MASSSRTSVNIYNNKIIGLFWLCVRSLLTHSWLSGKLFTDERSVLDKALKLDSSLQSSSSSSSSPPTPPPPPSPPQSRRQSWTPNPRISSVLKMRL